MGHKALMAGLLITGLLSAGCESAGKTADTKSSPSADAVPVSVVVTMNNVLGQNCEALTGQFSELHNGAVVTLEDSDTSAEVGRARLGEPPTPAPDALCAWGASISGILINGHSYVATVADRWTSKPATTDYLTSGATLFITAE